MTEWSLAACVSQKPPSWQRALAVTGSGQGLRLAGMMTPLSGPAGWLRAHPRLNCRQTEAE